MGWFRLYFLGDQADIRNVDEFHEDNDQSALIIADCLYDAVSDIYAGYELWQDGRLVFRCATPFEPRPFISEGVVTPKVKVEVLQRGKILLQSATAFATSRRLPKKLRELQQTVDSRGR